MFLSVLKLHTKMYYTLLRTIVLLVNILDTFASNYSGNISSDSGASWESFNGKEYHVSTLQFTFHDAVTYCMMFNSLPVEVDTMTENSFLQTMMPHQSPSCYWVGIEVFEGVFKWKMAHSIPIASLWGLGEPNMKNYDESICVRYKSMNGFKLADIPCSDVYNVICERPTVQDQGSSSVATKQVSPTTIPKCTSSQTTIINMTTTKTTISYLEKMLVEMKINDSSTSKYIRAKTCAEDKRISSKVFGLVGTVILAIVFILPVASDALNLILFLRK